MDENQNNIWINREEYQRLKALEAQNQVKQPQPVEVTESSLQMNTSESATTKIQPNYSSINILTFLTGIAAILAFIYPPLLIVFLVLGVATIFNFTISTMNQSRGHKMHSVVTVTGIVMLIILMFVGVPILAFGYLIITFINGIQDWSNDLQASGTHT